MKKYLFIYIVCVLYINLSAQSKKKSSYVTSGVCRPDSAILFIRTVDPNLDSIYFAKSSRYFYTYDSQGNNINTLLLNAYPADIWNKEANFIKTFDANNNLTDSLYLVWNSGTNQWMNYTKQIISYNAAIKPLIVLNQNWYLNASVWKDNNRTLNYYDVSNKKTASKLQYWDSNVNSWITDDSVQSIYNSSQRLVAHQYYKTNYSVMPPILNYSGKDTLIYNANNDPSSLIKETYDNSNNSWVNSQSTSWIYDANNRLINKSILNWNLGTNQWQINYSNFYSYDSNNRMIQDSTSYSSSITLRYYTSCIVQGFKEIEREKKGVITIYPNPTNSSLSISTKTEYETVKVVDLMGQTVLISESKTNKISVSDLSNGVYFIQILDKKGIVLKTEKFIKH